MAFSNPIDWLHAWATWFHSAVVDASWASWAARFASPAAWYQRVAPSIGGEAALAVNGWWGSEVEDGTLMQPVTTNARGTSHRLEPKFNRVIALASACRIFRRLVLRISSHSTLLSRGGWGPCLTAGYGGTAPGRICF